MTTGCQVETTEASDSNPTSESAPKMSRYFFVHQPFSLRNRLPLIWEALRLARKERDCELATWSTATRVPLKRPPTESRSPFEPRALAAAPVPKARRARGPPPDTGAMDNRARCSDRNGHDYLPDQPLVKRGSTATAICRYCGHTITVTRCTPRGSSVLTKKLWRVRQHPQSRPTTTVSSTKASCRHGQCVKHPRPHTPFAGRRWSSRAYPGELAQVSWVRADLAADLHRLAGIPAETSENMVLCTSEMFANACTHSRSGQDVEGRVVRTLHMPIARTIQLAIVDGQRTDRADFQAPQTPQHTIEEWARAERGRGLLLIGHLADLWRTRSVVDFPFCQGSGTVIWAEFTLPEHTTTGEAAQ